MKKGHLVNAGKTNPKRTQTNPIKANKMPKQTQYEPNQTQPVVSSSNLFRTRCDVDVVRAVKKCRYYLRSFSTRRITLLAVVTFVEFSIFIQGEHGVFI